MSQFPFPNGFRRAFKSRPARLRQPLSLLAREQVVGERNGEAGSWTTSRFAWNNRCPLCLLISDLHVILRDYAPRLSHPLLGARFAHPAPSRTSYPDRCRPTSLPTRPNIRRLSANTRATARAIARAPLQPGRRLRCRRYAISCSRTSAVLQPKSRIHFVTLF